MSHRLFRWTNNKALNGAFVGVMLQSLEGGWTHAGIIYRTERSDIAYVLHLWSNGKVKNDLPQDGQVCVIPNIPDVRMRPLAAYARYLYQKNVAHSIQYGFSSPDHEWISAGGQFILNEDRLGLTCSNFVLAIFRAAGYPLVQLETWPARGEDKQWQKYVMDLHVTNAAGDHRKLRRLEKVKVEIGTIRCRPIEMGGAALSNDIPCAFAEALQLSKQIEPLLAEKGQSQKI